MENYELSIDSTNENDIPIAKIKDKIISLHKTKGPINIQHRQIIDRSNSIEPLPYVTKDQNLTNFTSGSTGCGKTTYVCMLLRNYIKMYPKQDIFLLSALDDDPVIDNDAVLAKKIKRINVNDLDGIDVTDFKNSIVVLDDASLIDKKQQKKIDNLKNELLRRGRHESIDIITTTDKLLGGVNTIKENLHARVLSFFPHTGGNKGELEYLFKNKMRLKPEVIEKLLGGTSRWVYFYRNYPQYVIESNKIYLL